MIIGALFVSKGSSASYDGREGRFMHEYYVTFRSLTSAQQASFELSKNGIPSSLKRMPKDISSMGCGYGLRINSEMAHAAARILRQSNIRFEKIVLPDGNGHFREIWF